MLKRHIRLAATAVFCALACGAMAGDASAKREPEKKRWEQLRDKPVDYAPFERRRAENLKLGTTPLTQSLSAGFATNADLVKILKVNSPYVVTDEAVVKGLETELKKLLPDSLGIKGPAMGFVIVDDIGLLEATRAAAQGNAAMQTIIDKYRGNFTANATPGGALVIGLSVLRAVKSFDEIDFVIGHEASHLLYDHASEQETQEKITKILAVGALIAALATQRSDAKTQETVFWSSLGVLVANGIAGYAWDREQESEADELGYELLLESGMSAEGASNIFDKLKLQEESNEAVLDAMCGPDKAGARFLKLLIGSFFGIAIPEQGYAPYSADCEERRTPFASLFHDHPEVKDRREGVDKHNKKFYDALPPRTVTQAGNGAVSLLEFLSPNGDANRLVGAYDGLAAVRAGDFATAGAIFKKISRGKDEIHVPVLELGFYVANAGGRRGEALQYLEWAMKAPQVSEPIFRLAEQEYVKDGRWGDAAHVIEERLHLGLGRPEDYYPLLISYLRLAHQLAHMEQVLVACKALDRPGMTLACEATAHPPAPPPDLPPPAAAGTPPGTTTAPPASPAPASQAAPAPVPTPTPSPAPASQASPAPAAVTAPPVP